MNQPKPIGVCGHLNLRSLFNLSVSGRFDWIVLEVTQAAWAVQSQHPDFHLALASKLLVNRHWSR